MAEVAASSFLSAYHNKNIGPQQQQPSTDSAGVDRHSSPGGRSDFPNVAERSTKERCARSVSELLGYARHEGETLCTKMVARFLFGPQIVSCATRQHGGAVGGTAVVLHDALQLCQLCGSTCSPCIKNIISKFDRTHLFPCSLSTTSLVEFAAPTSHPALRIPLRTLHDGCARGSAVRVRANCSGP